MLLRRGSREIALRDSMINGRDVIYEQRLGKADLSSQRRTVSARGTGQECGGGSQEELEKFPDRADPQGERLRNELVAGM